jgi:glutamate N-acetyltransferase/amino-acid N-acetyltransferase
MTINPVKGFKAAGLYCGLKEGDQKDMALIVSEQPCHAAGVFTTNQVKAAPVIYDQELLAAPGARVRAVVANTHSANACTGEQGMTNTRLVAAHAAQAVGCRPDEVLVLSTGVIGIQLPMGALLPGIDQLAGALAPDAWADAASAIMTTDTRPKVASVKTEAGYTITGIAKGAGMIAPHMATMLAVIATDAEVAPELLDTELRHAAGRSFNRIVVDGDMSTNDTALLLANGASGVAVEAGDCEFQDALVEVCSALAQAIVRDGEGATKFVTVLVSGAPDEDTAQAIARSIAVSPLCKTAFYGADPNWGRVLGAAGYAGFPLEPDRLALWLLDEAGEAAAQLVERGQPTTTNQRRSP